MNVDDLPAVTVSPGDVVGGFDVDPDCAATATRRHAIAEIGETRIFYVATDCLVYSKDAAKLRRERMSAQKPNERRWRGRR